MSKPPLQYWRSVDGVPLELSIDEINPQHWVDIAVLQWCDKAFFITIYLKTEVLILTNAICDLKLKNCFKMRETVNIYIRVELFLQKNIVLY